MSTPSRRRRAAALTLIELLVVISITVLLFFLLANVIGKARERGRTAYCLNNLRQLGAGVNLYATDNDQYLPPRGVDGTFLANPAAWPGPPGYPWGKGAVWSDQIVIGQYVGSTNGDNATPEFYNKGVKKRSPLVCPADKYHVDAGFGLQGSYGMGMNFTWASYNDNSSTGYRNLYKLSRVSAPSKEFVLADGSDATLFPGWTEPYPFLGTADSAPNRNWSFGDPNSLYNWAKRHNGGGANVLFLDGHATFYQDLKVPYDARDLKMPAVDQ
jgi:prepilin-type processing-associated H-X9-DG protein